METELIHRIFLKQMKELTLKTAEESFDYQFSDRWTTREVRI